MKCLYQILAGFLLIVSVTACKKDTEADFFAPQVTTGTATEIYRKGATLSGSIQMTETTVADHYGILFSELQSMEEYEEIPVTTGDVDFSLPVQNLEPGKTYYFCTYAHSGYSMVRGEVRNFTTSKNNAPVFTKPISSDESQSSFTITSTLLDDGGSELMLSGFCYNEQREGEPVFTDKVANVELIGESITATIKGLAPNTTYQVRAYGASNNGVAYSETISVTTGAAVVPYLSVVERVDSTSNSVTVRANVLESGSASVTNAGFCLSSTNPEPTTNDEKISCGYETEAFEVTIENLVPGTTYYIRAYAENEYGTGYSEVLTFTTKATAATDVCTYIWGSTTADNSNATLWIDGKPNYWSGSGEGYVSSPVSQPNHAYSLYIAGNDTYIAGYENSATNMQYYERATVWKNGNILYQEEETNSVLTDILVSGSDVYSVGEMNSVPYLWKNGTRISLPRGTYTNSSRAQSLGMSDGNLYIMGYEYHELTGSTWKHKTFFWKNQELMNIDIDGMGICMSVQGDKIYCLFEKDDEAYLYKDGEIISTGLSPKTGFAGPHFKTMFVSGEDIYIVGRQNEVAKIWKNGTVSTLGSENNHCFLTGVYVYEKDVYVVGYDFVYDASNNQSTVVKMRKNGEEEIWDQFGSHAYPFGVVVSPKSSR